MANFPLWLGQEAGLSKVATLLSTRTAKLHFEPLGPLRTIRSPMLVQHPSGKPALLVADKGASGCHCGCIMARGLVRWPKINP